MIWIKPFTLEELVVYARLKTMVSLLDINIIEIGDDYLRASMPVDDRTRQVFGILHGGATCVLVETVGSFASRMILDTETQYSVGSCIHVNHIRQARSGVVVATARPAHIGRQKHVWDILVNDQDSNKLIAKGELTCAVIDGKVQIVV